METNNSVLSKYQNIVLTKHPDGKPNCSTFAYMFKYLIETEAAWWKMKYLTISHTDCEIIGPSFEILVGYILILSKCSSVECAP